MEKINITCGNVVKVQSSLDFYLGITSVGNIKDLKSLRKGMFDKFMKEYKEYNYPLVDLSQFNKETFDDDLSEDTVENKEEVQEESKNSFLQLLQTMQTKELCGDEDTGNKEEVNENDYEEFEDEYITHQEDKEDYESDEEYVSNSQELGKTYVTHGIYIEDIIDGLVSIKYQTEEELEGEDVEGLEEYEEYDEDVGDLQEYEEYDEDVDEAIEDTYEEENEEAHEEIEGYTEDEETYEATEEEYGDIDEYLKPTKESLDEQVIDEAYTSSREVSIEDDGLGADVPNDIRIFLKQHPNSDMVYVLKFYPKKEIEKQLKLGRIYKRKGKLFI